jgi:hypothetical protein
MQRKTNANGKIKGEVYTLKHIFVKSLPLRKPNAVELIYFK